MTTPRGKNADYWAGYHEEAARQGRAGHFESLAQQVTRALGRDSARKQRIVARSPGVFSSMDAQEFGQASSRELAIRELKELGIAPGDNDPEAILDATPRRPPMGTRHPVGKARHTTGPRLGRFGLLPGQVPRELTVAAFDAAEVTKAVRELAARHEQLHERLSRVIGPVDDYGSMTSPQLAAYGLKKLGLEVPADDDHPAVVALEHALRSRSAGATGAGMDAGDSFIDKYLRS